MPRDQYEDVYEYIEEELGFEHQTAGHRAKKPLPKRDIIADHQAEIEARARQRNFQGTIGMPPDALPRVRKRPNTQDDDDLYTRPPRSAVRSYQPKEIYQSGNTHVYAGQVVIPKRRSATQAYLPEGARVQPQQEINRDEPDEQIPERPGKRRRQKIHINPLVWLGLGMIAMFVLWAGLSNLINWWTIHQDDSTYGRPRTFQMDAVVGHDDSSSNPSHFIAINLNRHVIVIELPGGDPTKARIYPITTLFGDGQELTPVTLSFKDVNGKGLLDMEVHIENQTIVMVNDNGQFRPLKPGEQVHL